VEDIRSDTPDAQIIIGGDFNAKFPTWGERQRQGRVPSGVDERTQPQNPKRSERPGQHVCAAAGGVHRGYYNGLTECRTKSELLACG